MRRMLELVGGLAIVFVLLCVFLPWQAAVMALLLGTMIFAPVLRQVRIALQLHAIKRRAPTPSPVPEAEPGRPSPRHPAPKEAPVSPAMETEQPQATSAMLPPMGHERR